MDEVLAGAAIAGFHASTRFIAKLLGLDADGLIETVKNLQYDVDEGQALREIGLEKLKQLIEESKKA